MQYTWTDKVHITIVAPSFNLDMNLIDTIGENRFGAGNVRIQTRDNVISQYQLVETGLNTGVFTGEIILSGFSDHDADGDGQQNDASGIGPHGHGPTDGFIPTRSEDGITVSFEFAEDESVVASALIRWSEGKASWLETAYPSNGVGIVRIIDPDMNLNPEVINSLRVDVWSDSDAGGIDLALTETKEDTGIFEGKVIFTTADESSGETLRVAEGDAITAKYEDHTLPTALGEEIKDIVDTARIFPTEITEPAQTIRLENLRIVDSFGNLIERVYVDKQIMISANVTSLIDSIQKYYFVVQVKNEKGITVAGPEWNYFSLYPQQNLNNARSWIPTQSGKYTVTVSVLNNVPNGVSLADPISTTIIVAHPTPPSNKDPSAVISIIPTIIREGEKIEFSAAKSFDPDGIISAYQWNFGDGSSATGKSVTHIFEKSSVFLVELMVTDNDGAKNTKTIPVKVEVKNQEPIANISGPVETRAGSTITLSAQQSYDPDGGDIKKFIWDLGDGRTYEGSQISFSYSSPGQHHITLTVTDNENSLARTTMIIIVPEERIPIEIVVTAGIGGGAASAVIALTQIPKPISNPTTPPNVTLIIRPGRVRVGT
jgi:PKD repeat protein